ncbi:MAG: hypothetical protein R3Y23_02525 [Bacillota bacterium]
MKKKFLRIITVVVLIAVCVFSCVACNSGNTFNKYNGTYELISSNTVIVSITIKGDTATICSGDDVEMEEGATSSYECGVKFSDGDVYFLTDGEYVKVGTIDDSKITIESVYFVKQD